MARTFDGTNDRILSADNAVAGLDTDTRSWGMWTRRTADPSAKNCVAGLLIANGAGNARQLIYQVQPVTSGWRHQYQVLWTGTDGEWATDDLAINTRYHVGATYDRTGAAPGNDPVLYVDGVSVTVTEIATPTSAVQTGEDTLKLGENAGGTEDAATTIAHLAIQAGTWTAADMNRAMWWGRPHGGLQVYHPLLTTKLADEGSGAETLTATGTTVAALATPCVRPGSAAMGLGVGW